MTTYEIPYPHDSAMLKDGYELNPEFYDAFKLEVEEDTATAYLDPNTYLMDANYFNLNPASAVARFDDGSFLELERDDSGERHQVPVSIGKHIWIEHAAEEISHEMSSLVNNWLVGANQDGMMPLSFESGRIKHETKQIIAFETNIQEPVKNIEIVWTKPYRYPTEDIIHYWSYLQREDEFDDFDTDDEWDDELV